MKTSGGTLAKLSTTLLLLAAVIAAPATAATSATHDGAQQATQGGDRDGRIQRAAKATDGGRRARHSSASPLLRSKQLWATIDICKQGSAPMIGIRGSMPGDGQKGQTMLMRFVVQYLQQQSGHWVDLPGNAESGLMKVGPATGVRESGQSFELAPLSSGESFKLRGLIEFEWKSGSKVRLSATRPTTSGHRHATGARPYGFSAATCDIG